MYCCTILCKSAARCRWPHFCLSPTGLPSRVSLSRFSDHNMLSLMPTLQHYKLDSGCYNAHVMHCKQYEYHACDITLDTNRKQICELTTTLIHVGTDQEAGFAFSTSAAVHEEPSHSTKSSTMFCSSLPIFTKLHTRFENAVLSTSGVSETNRKQKSEFRAVRISILAVSCSSPFFQWICTKFRSEKKSNDADFVLGGQRNRILDMAPNRPEFNSFASLFQKVKYYKTSGLS